MENRLIRLSHKPAFDKRIFFEKLPIISDWRKVISNCCDIVFGNSCFEELRFQTAWSDVSRGWTTMYLKDHIQVLREHIHPIDKTRYLIFIPVYRKLRSDGTVLQCSPMQTKHFQGIHKSVKREFLCIEDNINWIYSEYWNLFSLSLVTYVQLFSHKKTTTLTSFTFVAYTLHTVILDKSTEKREWIINNG